MSTGAVASAARVDTAGLTALLIIVGRLRSAHRKRTGSDPRFLSLNPEDADRLDAAAHACYDRRDERGQITERRDLSAVLGLQVLASDELERGQIRVS